MNLEELRKKIDAVDGQIVPLYEERMKLSEEVADYKIENGLKVYDRKREESKIRSVEDMTHSEFNRMGIRDLYRQIMSISRKRQYQLQTERGRETKNSFVMRNSLHIKGARVVYQGAPGAYSQAAMFQFFGRDVDNVQAETFRDCMGILEEGSVDYAVLPIENSTSGIVSQVYDLLNEYENYIVGEQTIRIEQCLMALPGTRQEEIKTVFSHPQSLAQSARFLDAHPSWDQVSMKNNAFAARKVAEDKDHTQAAIAGSMAAEIYHLDILKKGVNQADTNSTRFIIVSNQKVFLSSANKISISFEIPHAPGALYKFLTHMIYNGLNMTKIESRPIENQNFEYRFFIDFEGNLTDPAVKNALRGLREETRQMRVLGNY